MTLEEKRMYLSNYCFSKSNYCTDCVFAKAVCRMPNTRTASEEELDKAIATIENRKNKVCKNCKYLCELWTWTWEGKEKNIGWCCNVLTKQNDGDPVVTQLLGLYSTCEMFEEK